MLRENQVETFFSLLGDRCRSLRKQRNMTQEDMMSFGFSLRHYQQIEAGLAINVRTAIRLAEAFGIDVVDLFRGLLGRAAKGRAPRRAGRKPGRPRNTA